MRTRCVVTNIFSVTYYYVDRPLSPGSKRVKDNG